MSNFFLCDRCAKKRDIRYSTHEVDCKDKGITNAMVMVDHGHANGRYPYDDPLDVCHDFTLRKEQE